MNTFSPKKNVGRGSERQREPVAPDYAVVFAPKHWRETFPAVGTRPKFDPHHWIIFALEVLRDRCLLRISVYTTSDQPLRQRVISRLVENPEEFGFKMFRKAGMTAKRTDTSR